MQPYKKKISVDTLTRSGETFNLDMVISFTVINSGDNACSLSYKGESTLMIVESGTSRAFPGDSGYSYFGDMQVTFAGKNSGMVEIIKSSSSTIET